MDRYLELLGLFTNIRKFKTYLRCKGGEAGDPSNGETEEQVAASDGNLRASTRLKRIGFSL